ncbi:hypothetical protein [Lutibaculum baratangense]|nr:hypothetical protein [Lutibaculum baratangense]
MPVARVLAVLLLVLAVAGCGPTIVAEPMAPATVATAEAPARKAVAFEPITGLPADRTATFATALGTHAAETGLNVVGRDTEGVEFRLKGYVTARSEGKQTVVAFVWDVFADAGPRVHRIEGEERLPAALPDPWQTVTDAALDAIARRTVEQVSAWLGSGAPVTAGAPKTEGSAMAQQQQQSRAGVPEPQTPAAEIGVATTQRIAAAHGYAAPSAEPAHAFAKPAPGATIFITGISGLDAPAARALAEAMLAQMQRAGLTPAASRAEADVLVEGEATVGPEVATGRTVAIIWSIAAADGRPLGTIRQVRELPAGDIAPGWGDGGRTRRDGRRPRPPRPRDGAIDADGSPHRATP